MQELVNQSKAAPQSPSVPKQPGPPVMTSDPNMLSNEEATAHVSKNKKTKKQRGQLLLMSLHPYLHYLHF